MSELGRESIKMVVKDVAWDGQMTHVERLQILFRAFRERDDEAFHRAAEGIIADELIANHHTQARDLRKALSPKRPERSITRSGNVLSVVPKDRRYGEQLVSIIEPQVDASRVILTQETKLQVDRVVEEHRQKHKLAKYGYSPKSKLLFWGPPGCGKTLTSHLVASALGLPLGIVRLNALITSFLGETASHIQRVFELAQATPMVLLFDEADAIAKSRDDGNDVGELKRVVNSLLQAMDTFQSADSIVIAASNHQYLLDEALWRRFDDVVVFPMPSGEQLRSMLNVLLNGVTVNGSLDSIVRKLGGLSFGQVEKGTVEAIKTMILENRTELNASELCDHFVKYKSIIRTARTPRLIKSRKAKKDE